jgi:ATP phosphoribosyltransferase
MRTRNEIDHQSRSEEIDVERLCDEYARLYKRETTSTENWEGKRMRKIVETIKSALQSQQPCH